MATTLQPGSYMLPSGQAVTLTRPLFFPAPGDVFQFPNGISSNVLLSPDEVAAAQAVVPGFRRYGDYTLARLNSPGVVVFTRSQGSFLAQDAAVPTSPQVFLSSGAIAAAPGGNIIGKLQALGLTGTSAWSAVPGLAQTGQLIPTLQKANPSGGGFFSGGAIGGFLGALAAAIGAALAPFTGGTSLALTVAAGAAGGAGGSLVGQEIQTGRANPIQIGLAGAGGALTGLGVAALAPAHGLPIAFGEATPSILAAELGATGAAAVGAASTGLKAVVSAAQAAAGPTPLTVPGYTPVSTTITLPPAITDNPTLRVSGPGEVFAPAPAPAGGLGAWLTNLLGGAPTTAPVEGVGAGGAVRLDIPATGTGTPRAALLALTGGDTGQQAIGTLPSILSSVPGPSLALAAALLLVLVSGRGRHG